MKKHRITVISVALLLTMLATLIFFNKNSREENAMAKVNPSSHVAKPVDLGLSVK